MKVTVDEERCRGHGVCVTVCPEAFRLTDDGYAEAYLPEVPADLAKAAQEAIECCPEQAITES